MSTIDGVMRELSSRKFPLTDSGNAEMLAALHGDKIRFDRKRGRWLIWNDVMWAQELDALTIANYAKKSARQRYREAENVENADERTKIAKWAIASESRQKIDAAVDLARGEFPIKDDGSGWDSDPWLLGAPNGLIDLKTRELRQATRDDKVTMQTGVSYDPEAKCPRFEKFILEISGNNEELAHYLGLWLGYSISGDTSEQKVFMGYGRGSNGKGTLLRALFNVLGDYAQPVPSSTFKIQSGSSIPNDIARMEKKRLVANSENLKAMRLDEEKIKLLSGQDKISARFLNREFFDFTPELKLWLFANHKPIVTDDSFGFWRRMKIIPFTQQFSVNPTLEEELKAEAKGILAYLVNRCFDWQQERLVNEPEVVKQATEVYRQESDWFFEFRADCLIEEKKRSVRALDINRQYEKWMLAQGYSKKDREFLKPTPLGRKLSEIYKKIRTRDGNVYLGVGLRDNSSLECIVEDENRASIYSNSFHGENIKNNSQLYTQPQNLSQTIHSGDIEEVEIPDDL